MSNSLTPRPSKESLRSATTKTVPVQARTGVGAQFTTLQIQIPKPRQSVTLSDRVIDQLIARMSPESVNRICSELRVLDYLLGLRKLAEEGKIKLDVIPEVAEAISSGVARFIHAEAQTEEFLTRAGRKIGDPDENFIVGYRVEREVLRLVKPHFDEALKHASKGLPFLPKSLFVSKVTSGLATGVEKETRKATGSAAKRVAGLEAAVSKAAGMFAKN